MSAEVKQRRITKIMSNINESIKKLETEKVDYEFKLDIVNQKILILKSTLKDIDEISKNCNYID